MTLRSIYTVLICASFAVITDSNSQMVNCAACAYLNHDPNAWECKVTCDVVEDGM